MHYRLKPAIELIFASFLLVLPGLPQAAPLPQAVLPKTATPAPPAANVASTPRDAVHAFLLQCEAGNYLRATDFMDLRQLSAKNRRRQGMELALQLEEVLNRDPDFDVQKLSDDPQGDRKIRSNPNLEVVSTFDVAGSTVRIELERTELTPGVKSWLFSARTVAAIPSLQALLGESEIEKRMPEALVKIKFMNTALWRWFALILLVPALGLLGRLLSRGVIALVRRFSSRTGAYLTRLGINDLVGPTGLLLGVAAYGAGLNFVGPSALVRFYISRILTFIAFMAMAWIVMGLLDILSRRLNFAADARQRALYSSVLPLALRVAKIVVFVIALVTTFSTWGYNTGTIWATLGVGSLAVALAAQKTLENFFGGVSVIGDRPVLVGDFCKVGGMSGTVEDIGLRSTRIRTLDRTLVTVPNSQFSTMTLENFAHRDKMWFHPTLTLRCDASPAQIRTVIASLQQILNDHPDVQPGTVPVRFTGIGEYAYNLEIFAYVTSSDGDRFLQVQTELLLKMLDAIEQAGTALAVPLRELTGNVTTSGNARNVSSEPALAERGSR